MNQCKICNDNYFILSNDEQGKDEIQKCDNCNYFKSDEEAKKNYKIRKEKIEWIMKKK